MLNIITSILLLMLLYWVLWCVFRNNKDQNNLFDKRNTYFDVALADNVARPKVAQRMRWYSEEIEGTSPQKHFWRRFTCRNPWRLYGPIAISLVKDYPMDEEFWEWYEHVYRNYITATEQDYFIKRMARDNWSRSTNPLSYMLGYHYDYDLDDFRPNPEVPVTLAGADEYDEIMRLQDAMEEK